MHPIKSVSVSPCKQASLGSLVTLETEKEPRIVEMEGNTLAEDVARNIEPMRQVPAQISTQAVKKSTSERMLAFQSRRPSSIMTSSDELEETEQQAWTPSHPPAPRNSFSRSSESGSAQGFFPSPTSVLMRKDNSAQSFF